MNAIDVDALLTEVAEGNPCGDNLEYDPDFVALERDIQGKPETQYGDTIIAAEPPDWKSIKKNVTGLASRTRDLRVALYLLRALTNIDGLAGFADGLALIQGLLGRWWDSVHPQLDPDDGNDPTLRVNIIAALASGDTVMREFREAPLVASRLHGRFSLRDLEVASGEMPPGKDGAVPDSAAIEAAFMDVDAAELEATADRLTQAAQRVADIEAALTDKVGAAQAVDLSALTRQIRHALAAVRERMARRGVGSVPTEAEGGEAAGSSSAGAGTSAAAPISGAIASRDDVIRMLDKISEYYSRYEPSSPVPVLLERAKRLVPLSFLDIVKDLAPSGLPEIEVFRGRSEEE